MAGHFLDGEIQNFSHVADTKRDFLKLGKGVAHFSYLLNEWG